MLFSQSIVAAAVLAAIMAGTNGEHHVKPRANPPTNLYMDDVGKPRFLSLLTHPIQDRKQREKPEGMSLFVPVQCVLEYWLLLVEPCCHLAPHHSSVGCHDPDVRGGQRRRV